MEDLARRGRADRQVEHMGTVKSLHPAPNDGGLDIIFADSAPVLGDVAIGDSICVNGACLTATEFGKEDDGWFRVGLANETLIRTNLGMFPR